MPNPTLDPKKFRVVYVGEDTEVAEDLAVLGEMAPDEAGATYAAVMKKALAAGRKRSESLHMATIDDISFAAVDAFIRSIGWTVAKI